ncbi:haloacid dehalogenase-like hydrolase [Frankia sp. CiP3]|uniref:haloacid dehalogenase-like hydrolase n=1 Tax=Frankia sp. CiP3 TaxID=2880971 RepID=UPI001EF73ADD|nr:haloacid dehalogenase-like hydrolase [Frankia sp. CiP3]
MSKTPERAATGVALFDLDGVLVRGDTFTRLLRRHLSRSRWRAALVMPVTPLLAVRPLRAIAVRMIMRLALLGFDAARFRARAEAFGRELPAERDVVIPEGIATLRRHVEAGDRVVIVTACERELARTLLDTLGLGEVELISSQLVWGRFGVTRGSLHNHGARKPRQLAAHGIEPPWEHAYSDSLADLPMLAAANHAVLVNPDGRLALRAQHALGGRLRIVHW